MKRITLNPDQIEQLYRISNHFKEVKKFTIEKEMLDSVETNILVKFNLSKGDMKTANIKVDLGQFT